MLVISTGQKVGAAALALTASLFFFAGCNNAETPPAPTPPSGAGNMAAPPGGGKQASAGGGTGQELLTANCRCHNGGKAPDLSHIGSDKTKTAGWIAEYATNPKSKNPNSKMPPQTNVSSDDMQKIATYLASQK